MSLVYQDETCRYRTLDPGAGLWKTNIIYICLAGSYALADVLTLSAAVASAKEGEVIHVAAGTYRERLRITHPVTLQAWPPVTSTVQQATLDVFHVPILHFATMSHVN